MMPTFLCSLIFQAQDVAPTPQHNPGLTTSEWLTIIAILVGPIAAVLTQLWLQARKVKRDQKLWVYGTLMSNRATWISANFVLAMNFVDVVFYKNTAVREKRKQLMAHVKKQTKADGTLEDLDWDKSKDIFAEMMNLMGKELGYDFEHTQIKDTAYYPVGHERMDTLAFALRDKGLAVLEGRANIGVVMRNENR
jgi:hypothetical protein